MANKLDAVSSLSFDNYALASYYREKGEWNKLLLSMEAVPSPDFHWWNYMMGLANHHLGNKEKSKDGNIVLDINATIPYHFRYKTPFEGKTYRKSFINSNPENFVLLHLHNCL